MFWLNKCEFKRGDVVKFRSIDTKMEVTYVDKYFNHNRIQVIFKTDDGKMNTLSGIHEDSVFKVYK